MKLVYKTSISYTHRIDDNPKLVDRSCAVDHKHDNVIITVKVPVYDGEFLDFKKVKEQVNFVLGHYNQTNITDKWEIRDTETLAETLKRGLDTEIGRPVDLFIQETEKYGIELVSN